MAAPNDGMTIAASWNALVNDTPEDNVFVQYWLLDRLKEGDGFMGVDGGDLITASLEYATNGSVQFYSDLETISTSRQDVFDRTDYAWKEIAGTVVQSELESGINQGSAKKFDLLDAKLKNLRSSLDATINTSCFSDGTGTSSKEIGGLQLLVSATPTTGTAGGINRGSFAFWRNIQVTGTKTTSAYDNLRASMRSCYNQCGNGYDQQHPTFAVTTRTVFEAFEGLLLANERFTDKSSGEGAFKNEVMKYKGAKLAYDSACYSGYLYFLNPKFLKLAYLKGHWYKPSPAVEPANQTARVFKVHAISNLITTNSRRLGVVTVIT